MGRKSTAGRASVATVTVCGMKRQRYTLIDIPQLSEAELCAVIRHGSQENATFAWRERRRRGDAVRHFREVVLPQIKAAQGE